MQDRIAAEVSNDRYATSDPHELTTIWHELQLTLSAVHPPSLTLAQVSTVGDLRFIIIR